jgi:hypothetical protein
MSVERAVELAERFSGFKRLAAGAPAAEFPGEKVSSPRASFQEVAIAIGDWYLTQLRGDVNVIREGAAPQEKSALSRFYRLLKDQRDYSAHPADYDRKAEAEAWREDVRRKRSQPSADRDLIDALVNELCTALDCLCVVAARIVNHATDSQAWRETAALSPEEEVRAVYSNLGRHLPEHRLKYVALQFNKHPDLARAKSRQQRANVGELVALGVLAAPLRVPYDEILDEFGLIGDSRASALLLIAHGVQASGVPEARLIPVLGEVWDAVQRGGSSA